MAVVTFTGKVSKIELFEQVGQVGRTAGWERSVVDTPLDSSFGARVPFTGENADVGAPEGSVTQSVADGIDGAVYVAEVVAKVPQFLGETVVLLARRQRFEQNEHVVRRPRQNESQKDGR